MNTRVRESKGITIEGIHKIRGIKIYTHRRDREPYSIRVTLSSIKDTTYAGIVHITKDNQLLDSKHHWILDRMNRELRVYRGNYIMPLHTHSITLRDIQTKESLRHLISDIVSKEWEFKGIIHAPFNPF